MRQPPCICGVSLVVSDQGEGVIPSAASTMRCQALCPSLDCLSVCRFIDHTQLNKFLFNFCF